MTWQQPGQTADSGQFPSLQAYVVPEGTPQTGPENPYPNSAVQSIVSGTNLVKNVTGDQPEQVMKMPASSPAV